jgi:phenylpropionate dioxygenase-like ring-hydroxylating dioxygenase large terminal subunit
MFVNTEHLPQVLTSHDYTSDEQFEREMALLFQPAWHLVATMSDVPKNGDFHTRHIFGQPLLIWNSNGSYHTFLNVCPHRFSRIAKAERGCSPERLKCQYHGWEFDETGRTRKIPDAPSFKPLTQGELGLKRYRTETCGQLIFATFADDGPSLEEYLGDLYAVAADLCSPNTILASAMDLEYDVNWKIKVENSLEGYHLTEVHKGTFGRTPEPEICFHELEPRWTGFETTQAAATPLQRWLDDMTHRMVGQVNTNAFHHYVHYPHFMFGRTRLFTFCEAVYPVSAKRTTNLMRLFSHKSRSGKLISRTACRLMALWGKDYFGKVAQEDLAIIHEVQKGHESVRRPSNGLVSVREERCFHFQDWVKKETQGDALHRSGNGKSHAATGPHFQPHAAR